MLATYDLPFTPVPPVRLGRYSEVPWPPPGVQTTLPPKIDGYRQDILQRPPHNLLSAPIKAWINLYLDAAYDSDAPHFVKRTTTTQDIIKKGELAFLRSNPTTFPHPIIMEAQRCVEQRVFRQEPTTSVNTRGLLSELNQLLPPFILQSDLSYCLDHWTSTNLGVFFAPADYPPPKMYEAHLYFGGLGMMAPDDVEYPPSIPMNGAKYVGKVHAGQRNSTYIISPPITTRATRLPPINSILALARVIPHSSAPTSIALRCNVLRINDRAHYTPPSDLRNADFTPGKEICIMLSSKQDVAPFYFPHFRDLFHELFILSTEPSLAEYRSTSIDTEEWTTAVKNLYDEDAQEQNLRFFQDEFLLTEPPSSYDSITLVEAIKKACVRITCGVNSFLPTFRCTLLNRFNRDLPPHLRKLGELLSFDVMDQAGRPMMATAFPLSLLMAPQYTRARGIVELHRDAKDPMRAQTEPVGPRLLSMQEWGKKALNAHRLTTEYDPALTMNMPPVPSSQDSAPVSELTGEDDHTGVLKNTISLNQTPGAGKAPSRSFFPIFSTPTSTSSTVNSKKSVLYSEPNFPVTPIIDENNFLRQELEPPIQSEPYQAPYTDLKDGRNTQVTPSSPQQDQEEYFVLGTRGEEGPDLEEERLWDELMPPRNIEEECVFDEELHKLDPQVETIVNAALSNQYHVPSIILTACSTTQFGDPINFKDPEDTRIATQNIGQFVGQNKWPYILEHCKLKMDNNKIDILFLQETHLAADAPIIPLIMKEAATRGLTITFGGRLTSTTANNYTAGVAILTPNSWSVQERVMPTTTTLPERAITLLAPLNAQHRTVSQTNPALVALTSVYGFSGHTGHLTSEQREQAITLSRKVCDNHTWLSQHTPISIIGADCNLIFDPDTDTHSESAAMVHDTAFLSVCINELGYQDALRERFPTTPLRTHHPIQSSNPQHPSIVYRREQVDENDNNVHDKGSYLDRILVKGATVTRAGCVHPDQWPELGRMDHSLVYADVHIQVMPTVIPAITAKETPSGAALLRMATEMDHGATNSSPFTEYLHQCIPQSCFDTAAELNNKLLTPLPLALTSQQYNDLAATLDTTLTEYLQKIYMPILQTGLEQTHTNTRSSENNRTTMHAGTGTTPLTKTQRIEIKQKEQ
jgi:hypothetical protein